MSTKINLHVVGDSISIHYGPYLKTMVEPVFMYSRKEGKYGNLDRPEGANGGDSRMVLRYLKEIQQKYDVLLINCGLHDIKRNLPEKEYQVPPEVYENNLNLIVSESERIAHHLIWIKTTPVEDLRHNSISTQFYRYEADVALYNSIADKVMDKGADIIIDLHGLTKTLGDDVYCDHVHFKEHVRQIQAAYIAGHLMSFARNYM